MNNEKIRCGIYCRVSTENQAREGFSLSEQRKRWRNFFLKIKNKWFKRYFRILAKKFNKISKLIVNPNVVNALKLEVDNGNEEIHSEIKFSPLNLLNVVKLLLSYNLNSTLPPVEFSA